MKALDAIIGTEPDTISGGKEIQLSLQQLLDETLTKENGKTFKQSSGFAPSETNQCRRFLWYRLNGFEQEISHSSQLYRIFDNGNFTHERLTNNLLDMGILVSREFPIDIEGSYDLVEKEIEVTQLPFRAFVDAIIELNGEKMVVEIKSIGDFGFQAVKLKMKPKDDHYRQIQIYLHLLGYKHGVVWYENKNNQETLFLYVEYDEQFIEKLFKKYGLVYKAFIEKVMPSRPHKRTSKNCQQCNATEYCWNDGTGVSIKGLR